LNRPWPTAPSVCPPWSLAGGQDAFVARLADPALRERIKAELIHTIETDRGGGDPSRIQVAYFEPDLSLNGKTFRQILDERGREPSIDNTAELAIELQQAGGGQAIYHAIHEDDVRRIMQHPQVSIATDTGALTYGRGNPHPRGYGTFPRVLGKYLREEGLLSLPEAIHKMTGLPAARLGLADRGLLREGYAADLVIFDPDTIADQATFTDPHRYAIGIHHVLVNGQSAFNERGITGVRAGQGLRHGVAATPSS
jgi:dihydroorotase/N-acyl-D-amino-acid deacylase